MWDCYKNEYVLEMLQRLQGNFQLHYGQLHTHLLLKVSGAEWLSAMLEFHNVM